MGWLTSGMFFLVESVTDAIGLHSLIPFDTKKDHLHFLSMLGPFPSPPPQAPEQAWLSAVGVYDELHSSQQLSAPQVSQQHP